MTCPEALAWMLACPPGAYTHVLDLRWWWWGQLLQQILGLAFAVRVGFIAFHC